MKKYLLGPSAVRKLDAVIRGKGEVSSSPLAGAGVTDERGFEAPYTVRWAQSENSGSGAWLIWIPSETLLMVGSAAVDPSAELTAADNYPDGWYVLDMLSSSSGGDVYLNVHQPKEGSPTANFADEPDTPEDDETVTPILVATASVDSSTGERQVKQFVSSTITIGGGDNEKPMPWDVKVENGAAYVFSPVVYVSEGGGSNKFRTHTKVVPSGFQEDTWNEVNLSGEFLNCYVGVSVSGSGSRSYVASLTGGLPYGSYAELMFFRVAKFELGAGLSVENVIMQYTHGEPWLLDFGSQDRKSISLNEDGETEIKGFKSQASETSKLAQHLTADSEFDGQVLVRITDQQGKKQLVFMPIGNGIGGGGGGTTGYTGTIDVPTGNMRCNAASGYYIQNEFKTWTFENGLLKSVGEAQWPASGGLETTPLSGT